jgi:hypothetical protein
LWSIAASHRQAPPRRTRPSPDNCELDRSLLVIYLFLHFVGIVYWFEWHKPDVPILPWKTNANVSKLGKARSLSLVYDRVDSLNSSLVPCIQFAQGSQKKNQEKAERRKKKERK